jgi:hypothetical protein
MAFPIKVCVVCSQEFELKPGKPGFANRCPDCSVEESPQVDAKPRRSGDEAKAESEVNAERRRAIRDLLYRKDS